MGLSNSWRLSLLVLALAGCSSSDENTASTGGACSGACAEVGATCTVDPPAGSDAPSTVCTCVEATMTWDCNGSGAGGSGTGGSGTGGGTSGGATGGGTSGGATGGGQCQGACTVGDTCTINPPPGSAAPSVLCTCPASGQWCCGDPSCYGGAGGTANGGAGTGGGSAGGAATGGTSSGGTGNAGSGGMSSGGTGNAGSGGTQAGCVEDCASQGFVCCSGQCVNTGNDVNNCGGCGVVCGGGFPYCGNGTCGTPPSTVMCIGTTNPCAAECCQIGQLCCDVNQGPSVTGCFDPVGGTCPRGCPFCDCASAETLVATPNGDVPIYEIRRGDVIFSVDGDAVIPAVVLQTNRIAVEDHVMVEVRVEGGSTVRMSPRHPTATGKRFGDLHVGDYLGDARIEAIHVAPYPHAFTYDILPDTESGAYFGDGVLVGSTLVGR